MLPTSLEPYAAIGVTILLVTLLTIIMLILAHLVGLSSSKVDISME